MSDYLETKNLIEMGKQEWRDFDAAIDVLDGKASSIVTFAGVLFGFSILRGTEATAGNPFAIAAGAALAAAVLIALWSWRVQRQYCWAATREIRAGLKDLEHETAMGYLLDNVLEAVDTKAITHRVKARKVRYASWAVTIGAVLVALSFVWPA